MINIYVGNLPYNTTEAELASLFSPFGEVVKAAIIMDRETGRSRGFGFVEMADPEQGRKAIEALAGQPYNGRNLTINEARPREPRRGGGSAYGRPTGGGYSGGYGDGGRPSTSVGYGNSRIAAAPRPAANSDEDAAGSGDAGRGGYSGGYSNPRLDD